MTNLTIRTSTSNPKHHISLTNGTWCCHFTMHLPGLRSGRVRRSLFTQNRSLASPRRDHLFGQMERQDMEVTR